MEEQETQIDYDALEAQEWLDWCAEQTILEAENADY